MYGRHSFSYDAPSCFATSYPAILDGADTSLRNLIKLNRWKETSEVIEWFKNIGNKQEHRFIVLGIQDFYSTITKGLLTMVKVC